MATKLQPGRYAYVLADGTKLPFEMVGYRTRNGEDHALVLWDEGVEIGHGQAELLSPQMMAISTIVAVK